METASSSTPENSNLDFYERTCRWLLVVFAVLAVIGAGLHAAVWPQLDWLSLLYLFTGAVILSLRHAKKISVGKEGLGVDLETKQSLAALGVGGRRMLELASTSSPLTSDGDDPQKGQWGGLEVSNDRRISAAVAPLQSTPDWYAVKLHVSSTDPNHPLRGEVRFHLHPTFKNPRPVVSVRDGKALLQLVAWGAFTVGAETDDGQTKLELDLATVPDAPAEFCKR